MNINDDMYSTIFDSLRAWAAEDERIDEDHQIDEDSQVDNGFNNDKDDAIDVSFDSVEEVMI